MSESDFPPFEPEKTPNFGGPFRTVSEHFQQSVKSVNIDWQDKEVTFQVQSKHLVLHAQIRVSEDDSTLSFLLTLPIVVADVKMRQVAAEFLARAQYGLVAGCFEIDFSDGEIRFHMTHFMEQQTVMEKTLVRYFKTALWAIDQYFPGLMQVVFGGMPPEDAVYLMELEEHIESIDESDRTLPPNDMKRLTTKDENTCSSSEGGVDPGNPNSAEDEDEF